MSKENHDNDNKILIWGLILTFSGIGSSIGVILLFIYAFRKFSKYNNLEESIFRKKIQNKNETKIIYAEKVENVNNVKIKTEYKVESEIESEIENNQESKENLKNTEYTTQEILDKLAYYDEKTNLNNEEILEKITVLNKMLFDLQKRIDKKELKNDINDIYVIIEKMLNALKNKKSKIKSINNFTTYYLPVTLKILIKYDEVENLKLNTNNSKEFMNTVEEKIKMIKDSFNKQLESLFVDDFDDIEAELNVLETMLKSDGYTDIDDFNLRKKMD